MVEQIKEKLQSDDLEIVDQGIQELNLFCAGDVSRMTSIVGEVYLEDNFVEYSDDGMLFTSCLHDEYIALWILCQRAKQGDSTCTALSLIGESTRLPADIVYLPLRSLDISCTELQGIPQVIRQFKNLEELNVEDQELTELPEWLVDLKQLQTLHISGNHFSIFPEVILRLPALQELWLGDMNPAIIPPDLEKRLTFLYIENQSNEQAAANNVKIESFEDADSVYLSDRIQEPFGEKEAFPQQRAEPSRRGGGLFFIGAAVFLGLTIYLASFAG